MIPDINKVLEQLREVQESQGELAAVQLLIQNPTWVHARYVQDYVGPLLLRLVSLQLNNLHSEDLPEAFEKLVSLLNPSVPVYVFTAEDADIQDLEELHREIENATPDIGPRIITNFPIEIQVLGDPAGSIQVHRVNALDPSMITRGRPRPRPEDDPRIARPDFSQEDEDRRLFDRLLDRDRPT